MEEILFDMFLYASLAVITMMTILWFLSIYWRNVSIVDIFWGAGFVVATVVYAYLSQDLYLRQKIVLALVSVWGFRLSIYLFLRNYGKGEDYRYGEFRQRYGPDRYWWFSFFQVFLLQGALILIISLPILGVFQKTHSDDLNFLDLLALLTWSVGFFFETVGDYQLAAFKRNPDNKGKLLTSGLWRYTRHPNYFGDAAVWWGFGLFSLASGAYWQAAPALLMTYLVLKVSGVSLLEQSLSKVKPGYEEYARTTRAFIPWFPKKKP